MLYFCIVKKRDYKEYYQHILKLLEQNNYELLKTAFFLKFYKKGDWIFVIKRTGSFSPHVFCYKNYFYQGYIFYGNVRETAEEIAEKILEKLENIDNETNIQKERNRDTRGRPSSIQDR